MKIVDCFIFSDELDLLEVRLNELGSIVDRFVIAEGTTTFSGQAKPLHFAQNALRFSAFAHKIDHLVVDDFPTDVPSRWEREYWQRNAIVRGLGTLAPDDVVMIGDADEIPSADAVRKLAGLDRRVTLRLGLFYYYMNCRSRLPWYGTVAAPIRLVDSPQRMRDAREKYELLDSGREAGWHFSYLGGAQAVRSKIEAFSHAEYDSEQFKSLDRLQQRIDAGQDLFDRAVYADTFFIVPVDERMPDYVRTHEPQLSRLIRPVPTGVTVPVRPDDAFCPDQLPLDVTFVLGAEGGPASELAEALQARGLRFGPIDSPGDAEGPLEDLAAVAWNERFTASAERQAGARPVTGEDEVEMHRVYGRYPAGRIGMTSPTFLSTVDAWATHVRTSRLIGVFQGPPRDESALTSWCRDNERLLRLRKWIAFPIVDADGGTADTLRKLRAIGTELELVGEAPVAPFGGNTVGRDAPVNAGSSRAAAIYRALQAYASVDAPFAAISKQALRGVSGTAD